MRRVVPTLLVVSALAGPLRAQEVPREIPPQQLQQPGTTSRNAGTSVHGKAPIIGQVYIGEMAPDFVLDGSKGRQEQLSKHRGRWVLLVFADRYRDLAPYDSLDIAAKKYGARVIGVCHEKQHTVMNAVARDKVDMLLLADVTGEVSAVFGLYDWGKSQTDPGFFVINSDGTVRLAIVGRLFPSDQMLELLKFATDSIE